MKLHLPKGIMLATLAAMSATVTFAATEKSEIDIRNTHKPIERIEVDSGQTIVVSSDTTTQDTYTVIAKDGTGTAKVTGEVTKNSALMVREGTLQIGDGETETNLTINPSGLGSDNYRTGLSVAGKDAVATINKANLTFASGETALSVGGGSGNGTLTLDNSQVSLNSCHLVTIGVNYFVDGTYDTDGTTPYRGNYVTSSVDNASLIGKGVLNIQNGSSLSIGSSLSAGYGSFWTGEAQINVKGDTSSFSVCENGGGYRTLFGIETGGTTTINVSEGATANLDTGIVDTNFYSNTACNITVDGAGSSIKLGNDSGTLSQDCTLIADTTNSSAVIKATNGGTVDFASQQTIVGNDDKNSSGSIIVDGTSSVSANNLTMEKGSSIDNSGTVTAAEIKMTNGSITNAGKISASTMYMSGGSLTNSVTGTLSVDDLDVIDASLTNEGTIEVLDPAAWLDLGLETVLINKGTIKGDLYVTQDSTLMAMDGSSMGIVSMSGNSQMIIDGDVTMTGYIRGEYVEDAQLIFNEGATLTMSGKNVDLSDIDLVLNVEDLSDVADILNGLFNDAGSVTLSDVYLTDGTHTYIAEYTANADGTYTINSIVIPEPTTATLSLLALAALAARRRR